MKRQPQHILKKRKSSWEVVGIPPAIKQKGGNTYNTFLSEVKKVLSKVPDHALNALPLVELQKQPQIKALYERHFKNNPELINPQSVLNAVASGLLNYDNTTGAVRESIADVRTKRQIPPSSVPLEITKENEFDRLLLLSVDQFLARQHIPVLFLKSNYFTLRPHLYQVYQEDPTGFRGKVEQARDRMEAQIWQDYAALVNETNRIYLSRYPFLDVALRLGITKHTQGFSAFEGKLRTIHNLSLAIPGSAAKFAGLEALGDTYGKSSEAKVINVDHFMPGIQHVMTTDRDFVAGVLKNGNRSHQKVVAILKGISL